jgi:hypothetical protein
VRATTTDYQSIDNKTNTSTTRLQPTLIITRPNNRRCDPTVRLNFATLTFFGLLRSLKEEYIRSTNAGKHALIHGKIIEPMRMRAQEFDFTVTVSTPHHFL